MHSRQSFQFFKRGPRPLTRLLFFAALSLVLLFIDARYRYLESTRSTLSLLVLPIQRLATMPGTFWHQAGEFFSLQRSLVAEINVLRQQHQLDAAQVSYLASLQQENDQLRNLLALPQRATFNAQAAEIVYAERDVFKRKVLVNRGSKDNVQTGQVVMDGIGIVGQVTRTYPLQSEVTLITEKDHAVPVMEVRSGLRTVVFGAGDTSHLSLRYLPLSADIKEGDVLVTSGIDGVYPPGIPVARVEQIERDPAYPFARVTCLPLAGVDQHHHLLILSGGNNVPPYPSETAPAAGGSVKNRKTAEVK